jgi:hypothetical protein
MNIKVVIVILVVIIGVFVALLVVGGTQDGKGDAGNEKNGIVDWIESAAGGAASIPPDQVDIPDNCDTGNPTQLQFMNTCLLTVHNDSKSVKVLQLSIQPQITITAPRPQGGGDDVTAKSKTGEVTKVAVGEGDTGVALNCPALATCTAQIES